jgi:hypothetical protein
MNRQAARLAHLAALAFGAAAAFGLAFLMALTKVAL